jgi:hypothetical protein
MNDEPPITAAKLRIVTNNGKTVPSERPKSAKQPKRKRQFAQVNLDRLRDPIWQRRFSAATLLYVLLQYMTRRGAKSWVLTNDDAAIVGVDRRRKRDGLRELEADGLIRVIKKGRHNPEVVMLPPALW